MLRRVTEVAGLSFILLASPVKADTLPNISHCVKIEDVSNRRDCINSVMKHDPLQGYMPVDLSDFKVDYKSLKGKRIVLEGLVEYDLHSATLSENDEDTNWISVEVDPLPRDQRKTLVNKCSDEPCRVTIWGVVLEGLLDIPEIRADNILFDDLTQ